MVDTPDPDAELDRLAEAYTAAYRRGEADPIDAVAAAHPELADDIRALFPLLVAMEPPAAERDETAPARPIASVQSDDRIGPYRIVREIGRGGMGIVYEAVQDTLDRRVALKVLHTPTRDARFLERFRLEAQATARLEHPHIVPVLDTGQHGELPYYTMRFIEGRGLDEVVDDVNRLVEAGARIDESDQATRMLLSGRVHADGEEQSTSHTTGPVVPPDQLARDRTWYRNIARLGVMATKGLAHAHARGVLHRDLKPSNMILDEHGRLYIADFGLCKDESGPDMTATGDVIGSFRYMPPERFRGVSDVRGDVYGIGITLYELLARRKPYEALHHAALATRIPLTGPTPLREIAPEVPRDLERIVSKAISHDPKQRYATAAALLEDLEAWLAGRPIRARAPTLGYLVGMAVKRNKPLAITVASALLVLLGSLIFYLSQLQEKEARARFGLYAANLAATESALAAGELGVARALLEDAPSEYRGWEWHHYRDRLTRDWERVDQFERSVRDIAVSPDGRHLAMMTDTGLRVRALGSAGDTSEVPLPVNSYRLSWRPDGAAIAVGTNVGVQIHAWPGLEVRRTALPGQAIRDLAWNAAGTHLICGTRRGQLHWLHAGSGGPSLLASVPTASMVLSVDWSPDGAHVLASSLDGRVGVWRADDQRLVWRRRGVAQGVHMARFLGNERIVFGEAPGRVVTARVADGTRLGQLGHADFARLLGITPDHRLAITTDRRGVHVWDLVRDRVLRRMPTIGRQLQSITTHKQSGDLLVGCVDGSVHRCQLGNGSDPTVLTGHIDDIAAVAHHPGRPLLASAGVGGVVRWWDSGTGDVLRTFIQHRDSVHTLAWSPDGRWFASASYGDLVVRDMETEAIQSRWLAHAGGCLGMAWSKDNRHLLTVGRDGTLITWDVVAGRRVATRELAAHALEHVAVSPDGRWLAISEVSGQIRILDGATGPLHATLAGPLLGIRALAFHPDGTRLAASFADGTLRLWDLDEGDEIGRFQDPRSDRSPSAEIVESLVFSRDGQRLISGGRDTIIRIWDVATCRRVATLGGHNGWVHDLCFDRSGRLLASAGGDGHLRLWAADRPSPAADEVSTAEQQRRREHRAAGSREGLVDFLWQVLAVTPGDAEQTRIAEGLLRGLQRAAGHLSRQDNEAETLLALLHLRLGSAAAAVSHATRMVAWTRDTDHELHGLSLAIRALAEAKRKNHDAAARDLATLDALQARSPSTAWARVRRLRKELAANLRDRGTKDRSGR